jgi:hypothetical protein
MAQPHTDVPRPNVPQANAELAFREETLRKESGPFFIISPYDTVAQQVTKLGPSTATKAWLNLLVAELTARGF